MCTILEQEWNSVWNCLTPVEVGYSPAELLMSRRLHTTVPAIKRKSQYSRLQCCSDQRYLSKEKTEGQFDALRGARNVPVLEPGDSVWVMDHQHHREVVEETSPKSSIVQITEGLFWQNPRQIITSPEKVTYPQLEVSSPTAIISGIPQGSVLGLLLFLIYIDGLSGIQVSGGSVVLFADNLLLHHLITCFDDFKMTL